MKKRLTRTLFLAKYADFLKQDGWINLKTDCRHLHDYTKAVVDHNQLECEVANTDIYGTGFADPLLSIKTRYEGIFLDRGVKITYLRFALGNKKQFEEPLFEPDNLL